MSGTTISLEQLTTVQGKVLDEVMRYHHVTGEGCPAAYIARRLSVSHERIRQVFAALYDKGFLVSDVTPAIPAAR